MQGYKEGGILPKWPLASSYTGCMVGYPAVSVLADLVTKDLAEGDLNVWAEAGAVHLSTETIWQRSSKEHVSWI